MGRRLFNRTAQFVLDAGVLAFAYCLAYFVRLEGVPPAPILRTLVWTLPYVVGLSYAWNFAFGETLLHAFADCRSRR